MVDDELDTLLLDNRRWLQKKRIGILLCTIPLIDGIFILLFIYFGLNYTVNLLFNIIILCYIIINIATSIIGYHGILNENISALRTFLVLFILENIIIFISNLLIFYITIYHQQFFTLHNGPKLFIKLEKYHHIAIIFWSFNTIIRSLLFIVLHYINDIENHLIVFHNHLLNKSHPNHDEFHIDI